MGKRIYIYRRGATRSFALTGAKNEPRLPAPAAPDRWHFWMQISPLQPEHRAYGFNIWAGVKEIAATGYHLFTGSETLLGKRAIARPRPDRKEGQSDA